MSASELRDEALQALRSAQETITSTRFLLRAKRLSAEKKRELAVVRLNIEFAINELETEALSGIRDELLKNEGDLLEAIDDFEDAKNNIKTAEAILKAAAGVITVVGKVVKLIV